MYYNNSKNCCYKCEERQPNCHSNCEKYAAFLARLEKIKKKRNKEAAGFSPNPFTRVSHIERKKKINE